MAIKLKVLFEKVIDITNVDEVRAAVDQGWTRGRSFSTPWEPSMCTRVEQEVEVEIDEILVEEYLNSLDAICRYGTLYAYTKDGSEWNFVNGKWAKVH